MRLDKVDLNLFVVFDALYRERSVTKVAAFLSLTQPAVSNALSRLRQTFDDPLFIRTPQGMAPTPVADNVVADVREALVLLGKSVSVNARFDPAVSEKVFHLGMNDLAESLLLPRLQATVKELAPKVSITSYYVAREAATEELKAGLIDLLLDVSMVNAKTLGHQRLAELPYVLAMRADHPMLQQGITLEAYLAAEHLHVSSRRKGRGQMDVALHNMGLRRNVVMRVQNYLVAARIIEQTDLLWTVPKVLADTLPLAVAELPFAVESLGWNLFWHKNADSDPATRWIRERVCELVARVVVE
jgi:DNA-binding transcriptional LysR family regulator